MDEKAKKKKKTQRPGRAMLARTVVLLTVCGIAAFVVLAMKLYDIQIINSNALEASALDAQLRRTTIRASRGTIFDKNGKILAMSAAVENVFISPFEIDRDKQDINLIADRLSFILGVTRESILEKSTKTASQYEIIKSKVDSEQTAQVREFIGEYKLRGIYFEPTAKRYYPNDSLASQIVGFVGSENTGLNGLEQSYNSYLAGVNGRMVRLKNGVGTDLLFTGYDDFYEAQDGYNITLTIDS
jgi:stage V sporulation protein D (sporulation-specific penicillin-binding protein)